MKITRGFTLVELLVVVLILGALAAIAVPRIARTSDRAKTNVCRMNVDIINRQIELYFATASQWPSSLNELLENDQYFPEGPLACPFNTPYEYSSQTHHVADHDHR